MEAEKKYIQDILKNIQCQLKVPKERTNLFGKYKYRSAEDILEALKAPLKEQDCVLTITDEIVQIGDRFYVAATAEISDGMENSIISRGFAREEEEKKGMDTSQITGSASSYARKYALNGLFLIDDGEDADSSQVEPEVKEWFNDQEFKKLASCANLYPDATTAIKVAKKKYQVSKPMEKKIESLYSSPQVNHTVNHTTDPHDFEMPF